MSRGKYLNPLTINTDASYSSQTGIGSFAYWMKCSQFTCKRGGALRSVKDSHDAEIQAIGNALYALLQNTVRPDHIYINTDSKTAMHHIEVGRGEKYESAVKCYKLLQELKKKNNPNSVKYFSLRHVKAHTHTNTARNYVNDWCDKESRKHRIQAERSLRKVAAC